MSVLLVAEKCVLHYGPRIFAAGHEFVRRLKMEGLERRFCSLEDDAVRMWLECPSTYPEEYRKVSPFLLKSIRKNGTKEEAPYLFWNANRVLVYHHDMGEVWGNFPVLLAS